MAAPVSTNPLRPFVATVTILLIIAAMYLARVVVVPVVLSALLAFVLTPLVTWMHVYRGPRGLGAVVPAGRPLRAVSSEIDADASVRSSSKVAASLASRMARSFPSAFNPAKPFPTTASPDFESIATLPEMAATKRSVSISSWSTSSD